jgi:predicted ArsR family transcriptional regulator
MSDGKRRIIDHLKRVDVATVPDLASRFGLTDTAVRQHLAMLATAGLVEQVPSRPVGRGRPAVRWRLSTEAAALFPNRHGDLTVHLLESIRDALGAGALDRVLDQRLATQERAYRVALADASTADVPERVRRLAELRSAEGYLAEAVPAGDGTMLLVEHHCPIADAARACRGLCSSELELFRNVLGDDVTIDREQHLVAGDQRCTYRIQPCGVPVSEAHDL